MRYLGWGRFESDSKAAARARDARESAKGGEPEPDPPKMGAFSGYAGDRGRRVQRPPGGALPHKPPKRKELGIEIPSMVADSWPLKAKTIDTLAWDVVDEALGSNAHTTGNKQLVAHLQNKTLGNHLLNDDDWVRIDEKINTCRRWCGDSPMKEYLGERAEFKAVDIPKTHIRRGDYDTLLDSGKLAPVRPGERIRGWATGFLIPQAPKKTRRPVWETNYNRDNLPGQPQAEYTSRRVRRYLKNHPWTVDFDFTQYFDQFRLEPAAQLWCVVHYVVQEPDGSTTVTLCKLTRLPMGASFAPATAQALTDVVIAPLLRMMGIKVFTMIDNIRIAAESQVKLLQAVKIFLARCSGAGIVLNEPEWPDSAAVREKVSKLKPEQMSDAEWILLAGAENKVFLGEQFTRTCVRNAPKNIVKLDEAMKRLRLAAGGEVRLTHRNVVSLLSLLLYLLHTRDVHLCDTYGLLRTYSRLSTRAIHHGWDEPLQYIDSRMIQVLELAAMDVLSNGWVPLPDEPTSPSSEESDYEIIITIDASCGAWAALVFFTATSKEYLVRQGWHNPIFGASTVAEPTAVVRCLDWLESSHGKEVQQHEGLTRVPRVALITDHAALVTGQRRWWNHHGGFSANGWLNEAFRRMAAANVTAFHIPGEMNPADAASRVTGYSPVIVVTAVLGHLSLAVPLASLSRGTNDSERRMTG